MASGPRRFPRRLRKPDVDTRADRAIHLTYAYPAMARPLPALPPAPRSRSASPLAALVAIAALAAPFAGCGSKTPTGPGAPASVDTTAISAAIVASGLDADALFPPYEVSLADTAALMVMGGVVRKSAATATTLAFRRMVTRTDYFTGYEFSDSDGTGQPLRVLSRSCKYQKGVFQLVTQLAPQDPTPADSSDRLINKYLNGDWMRDIELRRASATSPWAVTAVSPVYLGVDDKRVCADCHAELEEVRLQSGILDLTLHGNSLALDSIPHLSAAKAATIIARSRNDRHIVVLYDVAGGRVMRRSAPNEFTATLTLGGPGQHHFAVEVLSDSTLFDDHVRVSTHGWQFLYQVDP